LLLLLVLSAASACWRCRASIDANGVNFFFFGVTANLNFSRASSRKLTVFRRLWLKHAWRSASHTATPRARWSSRASTGRWWINSATSATFST